jgi:tetratricopeptide (TPR) repeat protein
MRITQRLARTIGVALLLGCTTVSQEQEGDVAYRESRFADALQAYRRASDRSDDPGIWAKLGAAALGSTDYREAVEAYRQLANLAPLRAEEATVGIDLVARAALEARDMESVREAVFALSTLAPSRRVGRYALILVQSRELSGDEELRLIPAAVGAATDRPTADSLLAAYASALQMSVSCDRAIHVYRSVRRRTETGNPALSQAIGSEYASCALALGLAILEGTPWTAEEFFREAIQADSTSPVGRRSLVAFGDARVAQGDFLGGASAYQSALDLSAGPDSIAELAAEQLNAIATAAFPDDSTVVEP